ESLPPAGEPPPPIGVREGLFADDDEWSDADAAVLGWADRGDDDADGRSTPRGTDGGVIVDRPVPSERGWPGVRERLTRRFPASLRDVVTAPAASATLVLALVALAAALLATWFAWQHRPVSVAAPALRPSVVVTAPDGTPAGGSVDARTALVRTAAAGAVTAVASPAASTGTAAEVVVDVAGRVTRPGVVRLPAGSRVVDAIDRVGGVLAGTDTTGIGLARVLVDGEQILVDGRPGPPPARAVPAPAVAASAVAGTSEGSDGGGGGQSGPINLNSASSEQLDGLPGVGPVLAGRIVAWRTEHGPFRSPEQLGEVTGLGDKRLADLLPLVKV
uniref:ComEA family DNA-binding protein n=1 Tax=Frankia gtarii TaxID=2950102 RepID=UPI0027E02168